MKLGSISKVRILRDTPCGSAQFVADKLTGVDAADYREKASRAHLDYPCLAGMDRDPILKTEIMQVATECLCEEVRKALEEAVGDQVKGGRDVGADGHGGHHVT